MPVDRRGGIVLLSLLLLPGCDPGEPKGQVVARVDGEDITRRDLQIELAASGLPAQVDLATIRRDLLDRVIDRKLAAAEARRLGIDRTPEYLAASRRGRETLLVEQLGERTAALTPPVETDITRFIAANRARFDDRRLLVVDRIELDARGVDADRLGTAPSNDIVAQRLEEGGHAFRRAPMAFDTLAMPPAPAAALAMPPGRRPAIRLHRGRLVIDQLVFARAIPMDEADRVAAARAMMLRGAAASVVSDAVARGRGSARIEYQRSHR